MSRACCPIHAAAMCHPDAPALVAPSGEIATFAECDANASAVAAAVRSAGLNTGSRLALLGPFDGWTLPVLFGTFRAGAAVYIPNARLPRPALLENLARTACRYVLGPASAGDLPHWLAPAGLLACPHRPAAADVDPDAPATLLATSGSTGEPKLAMLSLENHRANAAASNRNIEVLPGDRWLLSLPLYHVSGLGIVFRCVLAGAAVVAPAPGEPLEDAIRRLNVTHLSVVATQLQRLLNTPSGRDALRQLKAVLVGGGATPADLIERAADCTVPLFTTYGLTETASQVTTTPPGAARDVLKTSGAPLVPGTVRVSDAGEIQVRGQTLFLGYLQADGALRRPVTADGWFPTGDLGQFDAGGNLVVTGRKDNMFVSGGENIHPEEIEAALCALEDVERAIVVPVPDSDYGYRPLAFIVPAPGFAVDPASLRERLARMLPRYKLPVRCLAWPESVAQTGIKPDRGLLRNVAAGVAREPDARPASEQA